MSDVSSESVEDYDDYDDDVQRWDTCDDDLDDFAFGDPVDHYDIHDERHISTLLESIIGPTNPVVLTSQRTDGPNDYRIRSAMHNPQPIPTNINVTHQFGDFIRSHLYSSSFKTDIVSPSTYYLTNNNLNPTATPQCSSLSNLFVGSIPPSVAWKELKEYFQQQGFPVKKVDLKRKGVSLQHGELEFPQICQIIHLRRGSRVTLLFVSSTMMLHIKFCLTVKLPETDSFYTPDN